MRSVPAIVFCKAAYGHAVVFFGKVGRNGMISNIQREKLEAVSRMYGIYIYRVCLKILGNQADAEDAAQDTYIKILDYMDRIDDITSNSAKKYVALTAESVAKNMLKREKRKRPLDMVRLDDETNNIALETEMARMAYEEVHARDNCIDRLNEYAGILNKKEMIMLEYHANESRTMKETAEHFGMEPAAFRKRMQRLREKVAKRKSAAARKDEKNNVTKRKMRET